MIRIQAHAKLNFGLRVGSRRDDGFHSISGRFQSIAVSDEISVQFSDEDVLGSMRGGPGPDPDYNLAWRAVEAVRRAVETSQALEVLLDKVIPVAAGLGGGSADCAAALIASQRLLGASDETIAALAPTLGSDVPFCLTGGYAHVSGRGDQVEQLPAELGYALAVVVPPVDLSTPAVYKKWDELGEPLGPAINVRSVPTAMRDETFRNDLVPAAVALSPAVGQWQAELRARWGREVLMSGSGPSLFAFCLDMEEARDMVDAIPVGARFAEATQPVAIGWLILDDA